MTFTGAQIVQPLLFASLAGASSWQMPPAIRILVGRPSPVPEMPYARTRNARHHSLRLLESLEQGQDWRQLQVELAGVEQAREVLGIARGTVLVPHVCDCANFCGNLW